MHKPISKQLNLDERQTLQLKQDIEGESWIYSDKFWKRALAIYGYCIAGHLLILGPILLVLGVLGL